MTTITEPTKRHKLTQEDCDIARFFTKRRMKLKEIGKIIGVDPSTVGKIQKADFRLEKYLEQRKAMNLKTKENKRAAEAEKMREVLKNRWPKSLQEHVEKHAAENDKKIMDQLTEEREAEQNNMSVEMYRFCKNLRKEEEERKRAEEVPGQMRMELPEAEEPKQDEQAKMMRFFASQVDKIAKRLDELIAVLKGGAGNE